MAKRNALEQVGQLVAMSAKNNLTVNGNIDTGQLRDSIHYWVEQTPEEDAVYIGTNVPYAPYIEFGTGLFAKYWSEAKHIPWHWQDRQGGWHTTSGIHPSPYLEPALWDNAETIKEIIKNAVLEELQHERHK